MVQVRVVSKIRRSARRHLLVRVANIEARGDVFSLPPWDARHPSDLPLRVPAHSQALQIDAKETP